MTATKFQQSAARKLDSSLNSKQKGVPPQLHKYIWGAVGIFGLFFASFPIAYARVANSEKFDQQPVHSITWNDNQKANLVYPEPK
ncbi:MAG: hypothetical protein HC930_01370 [Hydrococcus sp. SU_1_0]|nr:hypothetical protein [Hydrococcus sp. SU_1_0]